ncbi:hypothetical protein [uncultured Desulfosarcina sp.]|uniref:hypothetical protein n=1 Tax=uncultured Desulfosarcina sp. TaxID=218289 RepID=UPI0029C77AB7|nr:hypothetical protein [uncultured Desulfosarcina sp.]
MQQITIRGLEPKIEQEIRKIAKGSHKSINQVIKEIIHNEFKGSTSPASSLRELAGGWSEKDAAEFKRSIKSCEQIDEAMWK